RLTNVAYATAGSLAPASPVSYAHDANSNRTSMADLSGTTAYTYDALNRVTSINSPRGLVTYAYDCNDNRTFMAYPGKTVTYTYDALNRLASAHDGASVTTYSYDAASNVLSIMYPNGAAVSSSYDAAGRLTQVRNTYTGSSGAPISSYTYVLDKIGTR